MSTFQKRFSELLELSALSDSEVARALGVSKQTISAWKTGARSPKRPTLLTIAAFFGVGAPWLMGRTDVRGSFADATLSPGEELPPELLERLVPLRRVSVPMLGDVAAGEPILAEQRFDTYAEADADLECDYALRCQGDSMEPTVARGDLIFVRSQEDVDDGEIAVVLIDDSATLKRVIHIKNGVKLISDNARKYPPMIFTYPECDTIRVLGKAVAFKRLL